MQAVAVSLRRLDDSPVRASRLGQVCSRQWVISALPRPRPGISCPSISCSNFKEAWKTYRKTKGHFGWCGKTKASTWVTSVSTKVTLGSVWFQQVVMCSDWQMMQVNHCVYSVWGGTFSHQDTFMVRKLLT